ncbi:MAG: hypothetical protein E6Q97_02025 [Desulfurellales bacterium]|nr:MAG: hypothetical protein E6Q97_02025 [Desulfurellales bacterium]
MALSYSVPFTTQVTLAGVIDPDAYAAGTYTTGWVSMQTYTAIAALVSVGTMASTSTVDAKLQQATDGSGTGAADITAKAITQLTEAGTDSDKQAWINLRADELSSGFTHARLSITVATAASDASGHVFGLLPGYEPATDATSVAEIVA